MLSRTAQSDFLLNVKLEKKMKKVEKRKDQSEEKQKENNIINNENEIEKYLPFGIIISPNIISDHTHYITVT